jgi:glycine/D-amino acid oxidase-like deaminating enzyme
VGTAFHSGGFAYNPVAGLLLAELVTGGSTHIDISAFSPARFSPDATRDYLTRTLAQKDAIQRRH